MVDGGDRGWDVDGAQAPEAYVEYLRDNSESELMRRTAAERLRALGVAGSRRVLDAGCGIGTHARMLAGAAPQAHVVGVDRSATMLAAARERGGGPRYVRANVQRLPFADASFDLAWVERTLVHVEEPPEALGELRRVLDEDGRAVVAEADYTGVLLDCSDTALWHALRATWLARLRHPSIGRQLPRLLRAAGFARVERHPELRTIADVAWMDRAFGLRRRCTEMAQAGALAADRAHAFWGELEAREHAGCFFMAIPFVVAVAGGGGD